MQKSKPLFNYAPQSLFKYVLVILFIFYIGKYLIIDAFHFFDFDEINFGKYWDYRWPLVGHIVGGMLALVIGPFQFWKSFRNKYMKTHRLLGKVYLIAILIGVISGSLLAWTTALRSNFAFGFAMQMLAFAWFSTAFMAYYSVLKKRIVQHQEWMIRSYVVTLAFANFRWLADLHILREWMPTSIERAPTITWLCWTIPLLITEIVISLRKK